MLSSLKGLYISPLLARGAERSKLLNIHRERARYWLDSLGTKEKPDINEITFWAEEWISALDLNLKVRAMDYISSKKLHWIYKHNFPVNSYLCYFLERELEQRKLFSELNGMDSEFHSIMNRLRERFQRVSRAFLRRTAIAPRSLSIFDTIWRRIHYSMLSMSAAGIAALDCFYNMLKESNCPDFFWDQNDASVYPMMKFRDSFTYAMNLIKAGAGWFVEHNDTLFIIPLPQMKFDNQNRLHSSDSPAINWIDGIREYYWHDVRVDSRLVLNPRSITIEEFIATRNVEHRRVMAERIGLERIFSEANVKLLDSDIDYSGERQLLRLTLNSDEPIVVVKVICPSTGRVYFLRVPPDCTNIQNAIAWTFGLSGSQYKPVVET